MHQIQFRLGLCRGPRWRSLQRSPDVLARFQGPILKGGEGKGRFVTDSSHAKVNLPTKFEVPILTRYRNIKGGAKCRKWGGLGWLGVVLSP